MQDYSNIMGGVSRPTLRRPAVRMPPPMARAEPPPMQARSFGSELPGMDATPIQPWRKAAQLKDQLMAQVKDPNHALRGQDAKALFDREMQSAIAGYRRYLARGGGGGGGLGVLTG